MKQSELRTAVAAMITAGLYTLCSEVVLVSDASVTDAIGFLVSAATTMALLAGLPLLVMVVGDFALQYTGFRESLMMTREEWEEDRRATQAGPEVKRALMSRLRRR